MEFITDFIDMLKGWLGVHLFNLGKTKVTLWAVLNIIVLVFLLLFVTSKLRKFVINKLLARSDIALGVRQSIGTIIRYVIVVVGVAIILQTVGIDLSSLMVLVGALGVGLGFGLQNIVNNLLSGLIILFERPIKVGDRIEVGDVQGNVTEISIRATTVVTNSNIAIIIPNSEFISSNVTNLSYTDDKVRIDVPVGVSYNSNVEHVTKLLLEVADEESAVLKEPAPRVIFNEFGDNSLNFFLRTWTSELHKRPRFYKSKLNYRIHAKFTEHDIEIPFPQRDLHIRSGKLPIVKEEPDNLENSDKGNSKNSSQGDDKDNGKDVSKE